MNPEPLCRDDERLIALVSDTNLDLGVPRFPAQEIQKLADFLISRFDLSPSDKG